MMRKSDHCLTRLSRIAAPCLIIFLAMTLFAQDKDQGKDKDKKDKSAVSDSSDQPLAVDSARKVTVLPLLEDTEKNPENWGGYEVQQAAEFGGRISNFSGSQGLWDTFVNLGSGPRLMEYTLDMRSPTHTGQLFDEFHLSNFGYGGDPNNVSRLRISKGALYDFGANFHRDQNIFDYDLLANPLNPSTSTPNVPILNSPHEFLTTRRMTDVNLALFPLAPVRVKMGWSRVVNEGSTFSTVHEGTEGLLFQPTLNTSDSFTLGVSFHVLPKTNISYDLFYTYFKGDTSAQLATAGQSAQFGIPSFSLAGGLPVNLGLPFNTAAAQPCTTPVLASGFANPSCNGFFSYSRVGNVRTSYPTQQVSFQSNYFKRADFSGRVSYSDANSDNPAFAENFAGLITRTAQRNFSQTGSSLAKRITLSGDFGLTYRISDKLRLVDNFRYDDFRIPTSWNYTTTSLFAATLLSTPNSFNSASCPAPFTAPTCPQHTASSGADLVQDFVNQFTRQQSKINTFEVEYDFSRSFTAYVGYRYERRDITANDADNQLLTFFPSLANRGACAGLTLTNGICTTTSSTGDLDFVEINGHSALIGFSARPTKKLRINFDMEQFTADNAFTRISPRHLQQYKGRVSYKPRDWWNVATSVNIRENRNNTDDIGNLQHNRSYALSSAIAPAEAKWGLDFSYDYNDIFSQTNICFVSTPTIPGALSCGTPFLSGLSVYKELSHFGSGSILLKPNRRVTAVFGYTITSTTGNTLILNPIAPTGPLSFNYHLPMASLAIRISDKVTYKTAWNFYDYNEKSDPGPTLPRDFRGNVFTVSLRYSM
jgi:hypothetical protein